MRRTPGSNDGRSKAEGGAAVHDSPSPPPCLLPSTRKETALTTDHHLLPSSLAQPTMSSPTDIAVALGPLIALVTSGTILSFTLFISPSVRLTASSTDAGSTSLALAALRSTFETGSHFIPQMAAVSAALLAYLAKVDAQAGSVRRQGFALAAGGALSIIPFSTSAGGRTSLRRRASRSPCLTPSHPPPHQRSPSCTRSLTSGCASSTTSPSARPPTRPRSTARSGRPSCSPFSSSLSGSTSSGPACSALAAWSAFGRRCAPERGPSLVALYPSLPRRPSAFYLLHVQHRAACAQLRADSLMPLYCSVFCRGAKVLSRADAFPRQITTEGPAFAPPGTSTAGHVVRQRTG